uniref:G-protein coupled receptors family 2 profile 1 domain-containing protein n=1 Tax=Magallana gigas TaxID=29159 RepID=K1PDT0_MAGGI
MECSTYLLGELYCNATFDVQCWNFTLAGTTARGACPENHEFSIFFNDPEGYSNRKCETNGQWHKPNYTTCLSPDSIKGYPSVNALAFLGLYTLTCCYGWMLAEGTFLHFCLANAFSNKKTLVIVCCIVGWVIRQEIDQIVL